MNDNESRTYLTLDDRLLKTKEVAYMLNTTPFTLNTWRWKISVGRNCAGKDLKWVKLPSGSIRYRKSDVEAWMNNFKHLDN